MRPAAQLQATIDLLDLLSETKYPADRTMAKYFKQHRYIGAKDKATISEQLYTILRHRLSFEYLLQLSDLGIHSRLLAAMYLKNTEKDIEAYFTGEKFSPSKLRPEQIKALNDLSVDALQNAPKHIQLNVPEWLATRLEDSLGDRYDSEMRASNGRATTDIRVNTLKSSLAQVSHILSTVGYASEPTELSPWGIRFSERVALFNLDAFKQGWFEIQDEGSQLLALLSDVKAGQKVVDFCAGAGGKTLALAAMMENKGTIYACDVHSKRLAQLTKRSKRAGVHNVRTHMLSSEHDKWVKKHKEMADVVLIDAPCSGTGTWRRSPDSRWNLTLEDLDNLVALQQSILRSAKRLVKPGGKLLYATCSLLKDENENQVQSFLSDNPEFSYANLSLPHSIERNQHRIVLDSHQLRTLPGLTGTDGFYVSCLQRSVLDGRGSQENNLDIKQ